MLRRIARGGAAMLVVAAGASAAMTPASGQEVTEDTATATTFLDAYGWWNKTQQSPTGGGGVPAPPCPATGASDCTVGPPADGIYVAYDYESTTPGAVTGPVGNLTPTSTPVAPAPQVLGPTAYGAVRFLVPEGAETELTLRILSRSNTTPGGADPGAPNLLGCLVVTPGWAEAQNGRYDQGPKYDCTSADQADVTGDTAVFQFPAGMVQNATLDVAIVGTGERPFQVAFDKPTEASLVVLSAPETFSEDFAAEDFAFEDPAASFESDSFGDLPADAGFTEGVGFSPTADFDGIVPSVPVPRPQREQAVSAGRIVNPFAPDASRGERMMAVALLLLMAVALWWIGGKPVRPPRLLGSLGGGEAVDTTPVSTRGIGRFARARTGSAPRLF